MSGGPLPPLPKVAAGPGYYESARDSLIAGRVSGEMLPIVGGNGMIAGKLVAVGRLGDTSANFEHIGDTVWPDTSPIMSSLNGPMLVLVYAFAEGPAVVWSVLNINGESTNLLDSKYYAQASEARFRTQVYSSAYTRVVFGGLPQTAAGRAKYVIIQDRTGTETPNAVPLLVSRCEGLGSYADTLNGIVRAYIVCAPGVEPPREVTMSAQFMNSSSGRPYWMAHQLLGNTSVGLGHPSVSTEAVFATAAADIPGSGGYPTCSKIVIDRRVNLLQYIDSLLAATHLRPVYVGGQITVKPDRRYGTGYTAAWTMTAASVIGTPRVAPLSRAQRPTVCSYTYTESGELKTGLIIRSGADTGTIPWVPTSIEPCEYSTKAQAEFAARKKLNHDWLETLETECVVGDIGVRLEVMDIVQVVLPQYALNKPFYVDTMPIMESLGRWRIRLREYQPDGAKVDALSTSISYGDYQP
jgi:hypothetical protein